MVAKPNVPKPLWNLWRESGECDAGADADFVHARGKRQSGYRLSLSCNNNEVTRRNCWKFDFSHCKKAKQKACVCECVCCRACVHTNHCAVVTSSDTGLSSGSINSDYDMKNLIKRAFLRPRSRGFRIPAWHNNVFILLGVTPLLEF